MNYNNLKVWAFGPWLCVHVYFHWLLTAAKLRSRNLMRMLIKAASRLPGTLLSKEIWRERTNKQLSPFIHLHIFASITQFSSRNILMWSDSECPISLDDYGKQKRNKNHSNWPFFMCCWHEQWWTDFNELSSLNPPWSLWLKENKT